LGPNPSQSPAAPMPPVRRSKRKEVMENSELDLYDIFLKAKGEPKIRAGAIIKNYKPSDINLIAGRRIEVDFMATHTFAPEETQKAFELASNYKDGVIKATIVFD